MGGVTLLPAGIAEFMRAADVGVAAFAESVAEEARRNAPVGDPTVDPHSGRLRDSIHVETNGLEVSVVADAPEAVFVEFGTVKMPAEPFLTPALTTRMPALPEVVGTAMAEILR